jgi:5-methyltetrahydropteroyltriglutamate--homocysteine methyltransferase
MPEDRIVVLGLVTTKAPRLESVAELEARVAEAARFVPLERLALSPQCGFASTMEGNRISPAEQQAKLQRVAEAARRIWKDGPR